MGAPDRRGGRGSGTVLPPQRSHRTSSACSATPDPRRSRRAEEHPCPSQPRIERWHAIVADRDPAALADDAVFRSPAVHTPQEGNALTTVYLDGIAVHGIDMVRWDGAGRIVEFTVMVRPVKGLPTLVEHTAAELHRT